MVAAQEYVLELLQKPFHQENAPLGCQVDLRHEQPHNCSNELTKKSYINSTVIPNYCSEIVHRKRNQTMPSKLPFKST